MRALLWLMLGAWCLERACRADVHLESRLGELARGTKREGQSRFRVLRGGAA